MDDPERQCDLCNGTLKGPVYKSLLQCDKCGLYRQQVLPGPEQILQGMRNWALRACIDPNKEKSRLENAWSQTIEPLSKIMDPGRLYDVGGSGGFLMKVAQDHGWEVYGNEVSARQVEFARNRYGLELFHGVFEDHQLEPETFDVVTMWHSLEHVSCPITTLKKAIDILKPGGVVFIEVPVKTNNQVRGKYYEKMHMTEFNNNNLDLLREKFGLEVLLPGIDAVRDLPPSVARPMWRKP